MSAFPGTTGQTLSYSQVEDLWTSNGGSTALAPVMAAIAMAESGGLTNNLNNTPATGDYSVGLWQINYYGNLLQGRTAEYGSPQALATDPNAQAKAAISLAAGGEGLSNWTTYTSGAYKQYLNGANSPNATLTSASGGSGSASTSGCFMSLPSVDLYVTSIGGGCLISNSEIKALKGGLLIAAGGIIFGVGALVLVAYGLQRTGAGKAAGDVLTKTPLKATPVGRAATIAKGGGGASLGRSAAARRPASAPSRASVVQSRRAAPGGAQRPSSTRQQRLLIRERERAAQGSHERKMQLSEQRTTHAAYRRQTGQRSPSFGLDDMEPF